jgi:glycosyltransferase involved in cell wall biosynthesis
MPAKVIVVDNNSTDDSAVIAKSYPFVTLLQEAQQGIVFARNKGFNYATSDVIGRIDADVVLPPMWVEYITDFYARNAHHASAWTGSGTFYNVTLPRLVHTTYALLAFDLNKVLVGEPTLWGSNMALLRSHWQQVRKEVCTDTNLHEDLDLTLHLQEHGIHTVYDNSLKVQARLREADDNPKELWNYLQWWPNTLRKHRKGGWLACWALTVIPLFMATYFLKVLKKLRRRP